MVLSHGVTKDTIAYVTYGVTWRVTHTYCNKWQHMSQTLFVKVISSNCLIALFAKFVAFEKGACPMV